MSAYTDADNALHLNVPGRHLTTWKCPAEFKAAVRGIMSLTSMDGCARFGGMKGKRRLAWMRSSSKAESKTSCPYTRGTSFAIFFRKDEPPYLDYTGAILTSLKTD